MPIATGFFELLRADPALGYLLFATLLLAGAAFAGGMAREDFRALHAWSTSAKIVLALLAAVTVAHAADAVGPWLAPAETAAWWPDGLYRLPLYALGLAYGPSVGLVIAGSYLVVGAVGLTPEPPSAILLLELLVIGWLSIYPSPFRHRWAGPVHALLAYSLAWLTAGLTTLTATRGALSLTVIGDQHRGTLLGLIVVAAALGLLRPQRYHRWFPESRIHSGEHADAS